jgi:TPR repeat protein
MNRFLVTPQAFQLLTFFLRNRIPLSIIFQKFLMVRIAWNPICVHQQDSKRLFLLLMKRFLAGFARKDVPDLLNKQATLYLNRLNFRRAVKCMELSIQLENYKMADVCADLFRQGRVGVSINLDKALEIAKAGEREGNKNCSCILGLIFYDRYTRESDWLRNGVRLSCYEYLDRFHSDMPDMSGLTCDCKYCVTLKGTLWPRQHSLACLSVARDGYAPAQFVFGMFFSYEASPHTHDKKLYWFIRAAKQGHPGALRRVALHLYWGLGTEINLESAYILFKRAKEAGNTDCDEYLTSISQVSKKRWKNE